MVLEKVFQKGFLAHFLEKDPFPDKRGVYIIGNYNTPLMALYGKLQYESCL